MSRYISSLLKKKSSKEKEKFADDWKDAHGQSISSEEGMNTDKHAQGVR